MNLIRQHGRQHRGIVLLVIILGLVALSCSFSTTTGGDSGPPRNAAVVDVIANSSLMPWLTAAAAEFNATNTRNEANNVIYVTVTDVESGQAIIQLRDQAAYSLWIPDDTVWTEVLADQGNANFRGDCTSVATSPLVIAMWRPIAESLGWPGLPLGWLDVGSLAGDPSAWNYYSGGEFGDTLRLGHTHPGLSATGASTLLALVQSAQRTTDAVTVTDIQRPIVQASVGAFESAVAWFSSSTDSLGATMRERGATYLGAAVMYESTVLQHGAGDIVPVYPFEGTFIARHPACLNQAVDSATRDAAALFRDYLLSEAGQQAAVAHGLRPVNDSVPPGSPLDESNGIDLNQPQAVFAPPSVETIYAVQALWQAARKDVNLVMLLDTSGSMRGAKMENMRQAAVQFVNQMGDEDYISIIAFATEPVLVVDHVQIGPNRDKISRVILDLVAQGDTTLFDAIGDGATVIAATTSPDTTNAMIVLSDGMDTRSYRYRFDSDLIAAAMANNTTIFTIAYGRDADMRTMETLARSGNGNYYQGDEANIAAIYEEMSAAFGGTAGIGR